MIHSRSWNNKINRLHEQRLRIIYKNKHSNFEKLLNWDNSFSIHYKNMHELLNWIATELHKLLMMSPNIMNKVFRRRDPPCHYLRHTSQFSTDPIHSVYNGTESASYLGTKIWEQIPPEIKNKESVDGF